MYVYIWTYEPNRWVLINNVASITILRTIAYSCRYHFYLNILTVVKEVGIDRQNITPILRTTEGYCTELSEHIDLICTYGSIPQHVEKFIDRHLQAITHTYAKSNSQLYILLWTYLVKQETYTDKQIHVHSYPKNNNNSLFVCWSNRSIDIHFTFPLQGAIGIDRQYPKKITDQ